jgi:hypothetical protein
VVYVRRNRLLRGAEKTMTLDEAQFMMVVAASRGGDAEQVMTSMADRDVLAGFRERFGEDGLFRIVMMACTQPGDFRQFLALIVSQLPLVSSETPQSVTLQCDNASLPQGPELDAFSTNLLQPSLARKFYNPGIHHGYLVRGLGGPNILVSHPFGGVSGGTYGVGEGTGPIARYLTANGYVGSYLFVDLLPGLDFEVKGQPAWLVWFAIIAAHSDLVVFVRETGADFTDAQKQEIRFTPDRVQKKIIEVPPGVLVPRGPDEYADYPIMYITGTADSSKAKFEEMEAGHARPLVLSYADLELPNDRVVRLDEQGEATTYPADYPLYEDVSGLRRHTR